MPTPQLSSGQRTIKWPQFRLRTLMLAVTGCCVLFALMRELGPLTSIGLVFFLLMVVLHVAGNAVGTSLREEADRDIATQEPLAPPAAAVTRSVIGLPSRLRERTALGWSVFVLTALGAVVGGALSSLAYAYWTETSMAGLLVGSISTAIIGGFVGFLASSFLQIMLRAWRQASRF